MSKFLDAIGVGSKYRHPALAAAGLLSVGVFVLTRGTLGAQASPEMELTCSDPAVTGVVVDIARKRIFSGQGGAMFDEGRFGGRFANVVTETKKPLTCSADFRPVLAYDKLFLAEVKPSQKAEAEAVEEGEMADKLTTRMTWTVKPAAAGGVYVEILDGLETYD